MAALVVLALVVAVAVLLYLHSGRPRIDWFRPAEPWGSPSQDRDRQRLVAELRALAAADPPRLLS